MRLIGNLEDFHDNSTHSIRRGQLALLIVRRAGQVFVPIFAVELGGNGEIALRDIIIHPPAINNRLIAGAIVADAGRDSHPHLIGIQRRRIAGDLHQVGRGSRAGEQIAHLHVRQFPLIDEINIFNLNPSQRL